MDSETLIEEAVCRDCQKPFQRQVHIIAGRRSGISVCEACMAAIYAETERKEQQYKRELREEKWRDICPLIYRDTNLSDDRLSRKAVEAVEKWDAKSRRGLGIIGTTGQGKTRCLYVALRKAFDANRTVISVSHAKFTRLAIDSFSGDSEDKGNARAFIRKLRKWDVVLIDDIGKPPSTERADSELEELIEERTSEGRAILWTANGSGEWLIKRFGIDRGEPTVRRLAEFCDVITL